MSRTAARSMHTYVPDPNHEELETFVRILAESGIGPAGRPALVAADGTRHVIPESIFGALRQVADALSAGMGVTVAPMNALLTTQQAADFLGMSRPTFVRLLERGAIPMHKPGRHRFVTLEDLVAYQDRITHQRREALDAMVTDAEADDLYSATDGPAPRTR